MTAKNSSKFSGQTFVVTGTLVDYSRAEAKAQIEALGGKVSGSVSSNTDCVVVGEDPGSKADKAKQLGIKTLNEAAFKRLLGGASKKAAKKKATKKATKKKAAKKAAKKTATKKTGAATLSGQTFVVTGTLDGHTDKSLISFSRAEAKSAIEALGGKVSGSVSANTDCVVVGTNPGSKEDMAKQFGIKILNESAFKYLVYDNLDPSALLEAIEKKGQSVLQYAKTLKADRAFMLKAVKKNGWLLQHAAKALQADREVVLAAVKFEGFALQFAAKSFKADREIVLAAAESGNSYVLKDADKSLKADREFALAAAKKSGWVLEHAAKSFQADRDIVLAAVKQFAGALEFAAKSLRADREVVLAAVKQDGYGWVLEYASEKLQQDEELRKIAGL